MIGTLFLTLTALASAPDYRRYRLHELALLADHVVVGTIDAQREETFELAVEQTWVGQPQARLNLEKFQDWTCAGRYAPYLVGQRVLLFLRQGQVMGAGDEGEMPLVGEGALVPYGVRGSRYVERPLEDDTFSSSWIPLADIAGILQDYRASFTSDATERPHLAPRSTRTLATVEELRLLRQRSPFARELIDGTLWCECVRGEEVKPVVEVTPGVASARAHEVGTFMSLDDGVEFPSSLARSLLSLEALEPAGFLAGDPEEHAVFRLRLRSEEGLETVGRIDLESVGWKRQRGLFDKPELGASLALLGNRDDALLLVVGGPQPMCFDHCVGAVHLFSLRSGKPSERLRSIQAPEAPEGLIDGGEFGHALCAPGDLEGDGLGELVVARRPDRVWNKDHSERGPDSLAVLFLDESCALRSWAPLGAPELGVDAAEAFGDVLAAPGDVDGDGVPDLALGLPLDCANGPYRGALQLVFLTRDGKVRGHRRIDASASALALEAGDEFGASVAAAGDLDANGTPDLLVGGARALWSVFLARDGSVRAARRVSLESLLPGAVEPVSLAPIGTDTRGLRVLLAATLGTQRPLDVGFARFRIEGSGEWTRATD